MSDTGPLSTPRVVALFSAPSADDADALEWLRVLAAAVAVGFPARVLALGRGRGVLARDDLPSEAQRYLDNLSALGVSPHDASASDLRAALRDGSTVLRLADPARRGAPLLARVTDEDLASLSDEALETLLLDAGQVVRAPRRKA